MNRYFNAQHMGEDTSNHSAFLKETLANAFQPPLLGVWSIEGRAPTGALYPLLMQSALGAQFQTPSHCEEKSSGKCALERPFNK